MLFRWLLLSEVARCCSYVAGWAVVATGAMVFMGCRHWGGGEQLFSEDAEGGGFGRWSRGNGEMLFWRLLLTDYARCCSGAVGWIVVGTGVVVLTA